MDREIECIYETPTRTSKEVLREEIDQLRKRQQQSDQILAALASGERTDSILEQLRSHATIESISTQLDSMKGQGLASSDPTYEYFEAPLEQCWLLFLCSRLDGRTPSSAEYAGLLVTA